MKPGVYPSLSNADYHGGEGISKSGLDIINVSALHFRASQNVANDPDYERVSTEAQDFGTAFHTIVLEPGEFVKNYTLALRQSDVPEAIEDREILVAMVQELNKLRLPKLPTTGNKADLIARILQAQEDQKAAASSGEWVQIFQDAQLQAMKGAELTEVLAGKNMHRPGLLSTSGNRHELAEILRANGKPVTLWSDVQAEWLANNSQRTVLSADAWERLHGMRDAVMEHPVAGPLFRRKGKAEQSVYWLDKETGLLCRCRPDWWADTIIADLKSTEDASADGFSKTVAKWRYHVQDAFYMDGVEQATGIKQRAFVFVAVEKKAPFAVAVYQLDGESVALGREEYQRNLRTYAQCLNTGKWPGYSDKVTPIGLPAYYINRKAQEFKV